MAAKDVEASGVAKIVQEQRCVQSSKRTRKERAMSKEMIDSLDARLARVEISLGDIHERLDFLDDRTGQREVEIDAASVESRLQRAFDAFTDPMRLVMDEFRERIMLNGFSRRVHGIHDAGKRYKVPIERIRVGSRVLSTFQVVRGAETCLSQRKEDGTSTPRLGSAEEDRGMLPRLPERLSRGCEADHASKPRPNRPTSTTFRIGSIFEGAVRRVRVGSCGQQRSTADRAQVLDKELDEGVKHSGGEGCHGPPKRKRRDRNAEAHQRTSSSTRAWMLCLPTLERASRMVHG
ncbi:hypothetical protein OWV82_021667 [Melia azedarach]|uniref:Uncharacterized protein n=1 Tax=Melia azedarach TaxID=155640 RepID=A0ACC1X2H0_MELAZ|nr:hypothetical protein OWV82_021667 [Melia azedarach]